MRNDHNNDADDDDDDLSWAGLDDDAAGIRAVLARVPEMIIAVSSSKNIGLYRERAGAAVFVGGDARAAEAMARNEAVELPSTICAERLKRCRP